MSIPILISSFLFVLSFIGLGSFINQKLNLKLNQLFYYPIGYFTLLGFIQFLIYPWVQLRLPSQFLFIIILVLMIFSLGLGLLYLWKNKFNIKVILTFLIGFIFVGWIGYLMSRQTLGQNSFDYTYYLSMVAHNANSSTLGWTDFGTGLPIALNIQYDFQSYYTLGSFLLFAFEPIQRLLSPNLFMITSGLYIWVFSILFYTLEFTLFVGLAVHFKKLKSLAFVVGALIFLGFFSATYYNLTFAFFGNTIRTWIVTFLLFEIVRRYDEQDFSLKSHVWMMLLSSALIAVSSTGFFLGFMLLVAYVLLLFFRQEHIKFYISRILIIILPTFVFALYYMLIPSALVLVILVLFYGGIWLLTYLKGNVQAIILNIVKWSLWIGFPTVILVYSLSQIIKGGSIYPSFFQDHRAYDMVWYYFNIEDNFKGFLNSLFFISLILFLIKSKSSLREVLIVLIILFINPISVYFVHKFLASVVYYRSYELIFNPFTVFMFVIGIESLIQSRFLVNRILFASLIVFLVPNVLLHSFYYYHDSFIPNDTYNTLYKLDNSQIEPLSVLKTKVLLENYKEAKVVSQIETVLSHVPNVINILNNDVIRGIDKFSIRPEESKLLNIFIVRDFIGQEIFDKEPDYENTCNYLIDEKVDFVIVDKNQFYVNEDGSFTPLYFKVRDCSTQIYENENYLIYQFYW